MTTEFDPHGTVKALAFTTNVYRDVYPAIDPSHSELQQRGKIVVITGASRGLGQLGFAVSFAIAQAHAIVLIGRSADGLQETEKVINKINRDTKVLSIPLDVTDETAVGRAFEDIGKRLGTPQVLINNAGGITPVQTIGDSSLDSWWNPLEVNLKGPYIVTRAFLKLTGSSPEQPTTILNLTSSAAQRTLPGLSGYSMSKLALLRFTSYLATEYPDITSVNLNPGIVSTEMCRSVDYLKPYMRDTPQLVGGTAVWLASGEKKFLSGRVVNVNWDVEEIEKRKEEVLNDNLLIMTLKGNFGKPDVVVQNDGIEP